MDALPYAEKPSKSPVTSAENLSFRDKSAVQKPKPSSERQFQHAFHELESDVADLFHAGTTLDIVMDRLLGSNESKTDTVVFEMSRDEWENLFFNLIQVTNRCRDLRSSYYATCRRLHPTGNA